MYYVIQVKVGNEEKMIRDIKANASDSSEIEVFTPYREERRKVKGEYITVTRPCFPGYIFVKTDDPRQLAIDVRTRIEDFARVLGKESCTIHYMHLTPEEERIIDILYKKDNNRVAEISDIKVEEGNKIRVLDGPLYNMEGIVKKVNLHKRKVTVEIDLGNQKVCVDLGINIVG